MVQMAHIGIYVNNLERMAKFYKDVFHMHVICERIFQKDELVKDILKDIHGGLLITKLITDQGKASGIDDMLELLQVVGREARPVLANIYQPGCAHIGFCVDDLKDTLRNIVDYGGLDYSGIHHMENRNYCCFARDLEGNWLELIERH